jgi:predicted GNAT family acetyltransferase
MLFYRLAEQAVQIDHVSTKDLFKKTGRGRRISGGAK